MANWQRYLAELISTFALVFIGAGAVIINSTTNNSLGLVGIALAHGLVLMSMIYATAHISGAHVNPAVTISTIITKHIKPMIGIFYIISQLIGSVLAALLLKIIFPAVSSLGVPDLSPNLGFGTGILIEAILTFFLVFTVYGVAVDKKASSNVYGLAIGLVLTFDILFGGSLTGAAMNPARAFGPALASNLWATQLVYWIGPIIGAIVAGLIYSKALLKESF